MLAGFIEMMKFAILLALAVVASAASSGCFLQEDFTCVRKNAVTCGGEICFGHCAVELKKSCDTKVWFKTVCEEEDFCKEIRTPCGHSGSDSDGLNCGYNEECISDKKCKLVPATKIKSYSGWVSQPKGGGYFEVCKDTFSCAAVDPWDMDPEAIEVVCTKEYEIVEDMDCAALWEADYIWGGIVISEDKFFKMNGGFSCGEKLVGKVICVEATAEIRADTCGDGTVCDVGSECATRETCSKVAVQKPVCAKKAVHTCLTNGSQATLCGNNVCSGSEKCEIVSNTVCPTQVPAPIVIPGTAPTVVPGAPTVIPGTPAVIIPGTPPTLIPGVPGTVPTPAGPVNPVPQIVPMSDAISTAFVTDEGVESSAIANTQGNGIADAIGDATSEDGSSSNSDAAADETSAFSVTDANLSEAARAAGQIAVANAEGNSVNG